MSVIGDDKLLAWKIRDTFARLSELVEQGLERGMDISIDFPKGEIEIERIIQEDL